MFLVKVLILLCLLVPCAPATIDLQISPVEVVDVSYGSVNRDFTITYSINAADKDVDGIELYAGSTLLADCRAGSGLLKNIPTVQGLSVVDLPPHDCASLPSANTRDFDVGSGTWTVGISFSNDSLHGNTDIHRWSAILTDGNELARSQDLEVTVGDLKKRTVVTISSSHQEMVFMCSVGEVRPSTNLTMTVPGYAPKTVQTPAAVEIRVPYAEALNEESYSCSLLVTSPVEKVLTESFFVQYAPVFKKELEEQTIFCQDRTSCQATLNVSGLVLAYPAADLTWSGPGVDGEKGSTVSVTGPGNYTCTATNHQGSSEVTFSVVVDSSTVSDEVTGGSTDYTTVSDEVTKDSTVQHDLGPIIGGVIGAYVFYVLMNIFASWSCYTMTWLWLSGKDLNTCTTVFAILGGVVVVHRCLKGKKAKRTSAPKLMVLPTSSDGENDGNTNSATNNNKGGETGLQEVKIAHTTHDSGASTYGRQIRHSRTPVGFARKTFSPQNADAIAASHAARQARLVDSDSATDIHCGTLYAKVQMRSPDFGQLPTRPSNVRRGAGIDEQADGYVSGHLGTSV